MTFRSHPLFNLISSSFVHLSTSVLQNPKGRELHKCIPLLNLLSSLLTKAFKLLATIFYILFRYLCLNLHFKFKLSSFAAPSYLLAFAYLINRPPSLSHYQPPRTSLHLPFPCVLLLTATPSSSKLAFISTQDRPTFFRPTLFLLPLILTEGPKGFSVVFSGYKHPRQIRSRFFNSTSLVLLRSRPNRFIIHPLGFIDFASL